MLGLPRVAGLFWLAAAGAASAQVDPSTLPARDSHQGVLIAAEPYTEPARYKERFGKKNPYEAGILAIEVFIRNDNEKPIRLDLEGIRLLIDPSGADRQRLRALSPADVADRILKKAEEGPTLPRSRLPIPRRTPTGRGKDWEKLEAALRSASFDHDVLPPHTTLRGFIYFDVGRRYDWVSYARLYVPDLYFLDTRQELLFFEIDLSAARPR